MHIGICDDLDSDRTLLKNYISRYMNTYHIDCKITSFKSGEDLLAGMKSASLDILFLDIYMEGKNGIETARQLQSRYISNSLEEFLKLLPKENFLRCHRSYVLNMNYIFTQENSDFILKDGRKIPIPKKDTQLMRQVYSDFLFRQVRRRRNGF